MIPPVLIGIDWGGTHVRALALDESGAVSAHRDAAHGALDLKPEAFAGVLERLVGDWRTEGAPVLICGMAGSRRGWTEAPYAPAPASAEDLARTLTEVEPGVFIVPGVCTQSEQGLTDIMRGEETQSLGAGEGVFTAVCPGTHSKWVRVQDGRITDFTTYMTGELYAVLKRHSLLGEGMSEAPFDAEAFDDGARRGLQDGRITRALFSVRVGWIDGRLKSGAADYLSGLLIGSEIADAAQADAPLRLIGAPGLSRRYVRALSLAGVVPAQTIDAQAAVAAGLMRIWRHRS